MAPRAFAVLAIRSRGAAEQKLLSRALDARARSRRARTLRRIEVGGAVGSWTEAGSGPPVLLVASMLIRACTYRPTVRALLDRSPDRRVIALELPGSGSAPPLDRPWSFARYARWLAAFLDAMELERAVVIGHSLSGAVALVVGAVHPARISRLVLADPVGVDPPGLARLLLARVGDLPFEPRFMCRAAPAAAYNVARHARNAANLIRLAATEDLSGYAAVIRTPTLLAWGARDHTVPLGSARALRALIPTSTLHVSPLGSHDWLVERPSEFAEVVDRFLEET